MASRSYRLKANESPAEGVRRIALGRTDKAVERLEEIEGDELAAAVHGARKDLKKLRGPCGWSATSSVRSGSRPETAATGRRTSVLGRRDAEVKLETLAHLRQRSAPSAR